MQVSTNSCFVTLSQHFRFAQFFISPLLKQDTVEREIQAVESGKLEPSMQESTNTFFVVVVGFFGPQQGEKNFFHSFHFTQPLENNTFCLFVFVRVQNELSE